MTPKSSPLKKTLLFLLIVVISNIDVYAQCEPTPEVCDENDCGFESVDISLIVVGDNDICVGDTAFIAVDPEETIDFDYLIYYWCDGTVDTLDFDQQPAFHVYDIDPEEICNREKETFFIRVIGVVECGGDNITCRTAGVSLTVKYPTLADFSFTNPICVNTPFTFTDESCNAETYMWDFGDGNTSTEENPMHSYSTPGNYIVTLTTFNDCGSDETTREVSVLGLPDAEMEIVGDPPYCTPETITFIDQSNEWGSTTWSIMPDDTVGTTVNWCFVDTTMTLSSDTITVTFKEPGEYTIVLTQSNSCGMDTAQQVITIFQTPQFNITELSETFCDEVTLTEDDINFSISGDYTEICWEFINGIPSSICDETFSTTFQQSGEIILNISSVCGDLTDTIAVNVAQTTEIDFINTPIAVCQDVGLINLMDYVIPNDGIWQGPGVENDSIFNPANLPGDDYELTYSLSNNPDCPNQDMITVTVIDSISVLLDEVTASCDELVYTPDPTYSGDISDYSWIFNVGGTITTSTQEVPSPITFSESGSVIITVTGTFCGAQSDTIDIIIIDTEDITFGNNPTSLCQNDTPVQFEATPPGGVWSASALGAITDDGVFDPSGLEPGFYTISYGTANIAPDCPAMASFELEILETVSVSLDNDVGEPCDSLTINFFDYVEYTGAIDSFQWEIAGAIPPNPDGANPGTVTIYSVNSPVMVSIIVSGRCGTDTASIEIPIGSTEPIVIDEYPAQLCQSSAPITLNAAPSGSWSGEGISSDGILDPSLLNDGIYVYTYTTSGFECFTSSSIEIEILEGLFVDLDEVEPACDELILTPSVDYTGTADNITWTFPGASPSSSNEANPQNIVFGPDTVYISVLLEDDVCPSVVDSVIVVVQENVELSIDAVPQPICSGSSPINLAANVEGGTWIGPGIIDEIEGIFDPASVDANMSYIIYYNLEAAACIAQDSIILNVVESPQVSIGDAILCEDSAPLMLSAMPFDGTGVFSGIGITDSIQGIFDATMVTPGETYTVFYAYTDMNNCEVVVSSEVVVEVFPVQTFIDTLELCLSDITVNLQELTAYGVSPDGGETLWNGPGIIDNALGFFNPIQTGLGIGTYDINISYNRNDCSIQDVLVIELIQAEMLVLSAPEEMVCIEDGTLQLITNLTGGTWDGPGIDSVSGIITLSVAGGGEHDYSYVFQPGTSCEQNSTITIIVADPQSEVEAGEEPIEICEGPSVYQLPAGIPLGIGTWNGEGIIDSTAGIIDLIQLQLDTQYFYKYCFETPNLTGCSACDSIGFTLLSRPITDFDIIGRTCIGETFCMVNLTENGVSYEWNFEGDDIITDPEPCYSYNTPGNKTIRLVAIGANDCRDTIFQEIYVSSPPTVDFTLLDDEGCAPFEVQIENNSFGDSITQVWYINNDTIIGADLEGIILDDITDDSIFVITLEVQNLCDTIRQVDSILVHPYPLANFGIEFDEGCSPLEVDFIDITLGNPDTIFWDMGNGNTYFYTGGVDPDLPPNQVYYTSNTESTTYEITLIASNFCGVDTFFQTLTVDPPEVEAFIQQDTLVGCQPFDASFLSTSTPGTISTWEVIWQEGDYILGSNQVNPTFSLDSAGTYMVILYATSNCDQARDTAFVEVLPAPDVSFEIPPYVCDGLPVSFLNTSIEVGGSFWDFGDGNTSDETSPTHIYDSAGVYVITLTANSLENNCPASYTDSIRIEANPIAAFSVDTTAGCLPLTIQFTDESIGETSWNWDFGYETSASIDENPVHTFEETGNYIVTLVVRDEFNCASDTAITNIFVNEHPSSSFIFEDLEYCENYDSICFTNTSEGAILYEWNIFGEIYTEVNPCVFAESAVENDTIWLIATNQDGCQDTSFQLITILPSPVAIAGASPAIGCEDLWVSFTNNSKNADNNNWRFGNGDSSTDFNPSYLFTEDGIYDVELIVSNFNGCPSDTTYVEVNVLEKPTADFELEKQQICGVPTEVVFQNTSIGNIDNQWDFGNNISSEETNPIHFYETEGTFTVTLIITNEVGCLDTIAKDVEIFNQPVANLSISEPEGCEDHELTIYNTSTQDNYVEWNVESIGTFTNPDSITFELTEPGSYSIGIIAYYNEFCTDTLYWMDTVKVYETPIADFDFEREFLDTIIGEVQFDNQSELAQDYEWDLGDGTISFEESPFHEYDTNRFIPVLLTAYNYNDGAFVCIDTITKFIDPGLIKTFFVPNALTLDYGSEEIQVFKPVGIGIKSYTLDIYSPYGNLVFHTEELNGDKPSGVWDGTFKGKNVTSGAYVWVARITYIDNSKELKKGTVTVLR